MNRVHFANTFFEQELEQIQEHSLEAYLNATPIPLQLQFLSLLYREAQEKALFSTLPPQSYLNFLSSQGFSIEGIELLDSPLSSGFELDLWGASRAARTWAKQCGGIVSFPDWDLVRKIHSKLFSFAATPQIPHSRLLQTVDEAEEWNASFSGPKILKKAFGVAGSGHVSIDEVIPPHLSFPLIGEPWVHRLFDFSTQWYINDRGVEYIGATVLETSSQGVYLGTWAGNEDLLFQKHPGALGLHLEQCRPILKHIHALGFFGHLGIDAFVYEWKGERRLRAMSEINARKTMGWVALQIQRLHYPKHLLKIRYEKTHLPGFLPTQLKKSRFQRQLLFITQ